jgi:hypothetical protein
MILAAVEQASAEPGWHWWVVTVPALLGFLSGGKSLTPDQQRDLNRELCYGLLKLVGKRGLNLLIRRD